MDEDFKKDIAKIVLNKFLIGILILFAGLYGNSLLEKYKLDQSFKNDIRKIQARKTGDVWESLYIVEASINDIVKKMVKRDLETPDSEKWNKLTQELKDLSIENAELLNALTQKININRFWLGEDQYEFVTHYTYLFPDLLSAYAEKDIEKFKSVMKEQKKAKISIRKIRDQLLNE